MGDDLSFHEKMSKLFKENPEAFETERKRLIEEIIQNAPPNQQLKLRVIQAKVDGALKRAGEENRLAVMEGLFWEDFLGSFAPTMRGLNDRNKEPR
jgi:hypothetical protein